MSELIPVFDTVAAIRAAVQDQRRLGRRIGLVPTMGALHRGHARLIEACRREADCVVVSIFVNPTQFGPAEDFTRYPRMPAQDHALCVASGATLVFEPTVEHIYPAGQSATVVDVPALSRILEGASRPGHFQGVATVVTKLFQIVRPDLAFFGDKDYQQLQIVRRLTTDLDFEIAIHEIPTVREPDGLALSSRNAYLSSAARSAAGVLHKALESARVAVFRGERSGERIRQIVSDLINSESLSRLDYAQIVHPFSLAPLDWLEPGSTAVALVAAHFEGTRLIDHMELPVAAE